MVKTEALDLPCDIPERFKPDGYIASGELYFSVGGTVRLRTLFSGDTAFHQDAL